MNRIKAYLAGAFLLTGAACINTASAQTDTTRRDSTHQHHRSENPARSNETLAYTYIDLNSGDTLDYWYDTDKKIVMNRTNNSPVDFYINTTTGDTVYGKGRFVVNGLLLKGDDGKWKFDDNKVKIDGDELKIKDGKRKLKIDGDDIKVKGDGQKIKAEGNEAKMKDKENKTKAKIDKDEMKVKDEQGKAKYEKDKTKIKEGDTKIKKKGDSTQIKNDN